MCVSGNTKSKYEKKIAKRLNAFYPNLTVICNDKEVLSGLELDMYIPSLKIGVEIQGPHHYFPKYGTKKFNKIKNNDKRKRQLCKDKNIDLVVLDISRLSLRNTVEFSMVFDMLVRRINEVMGTKNFEMRVR